MTKDKSEDCCRGCPRSGGTCNLGDCVLDDLGMVRYMLDWLPSATRQAVNADSPAFLPRPGQRPDGPPERVV
jgi:hypothetical protein